MRKYPIVEIEDVTEPFCGRRRRDSVPLLDAEPEIAAEWLYSKNAGWGPDDFSRSSGVRCWWECPDCKRAYKAQICNRTADSVRSGCPYCASKRVCSDNSLADLSPEVAAEWHPSKNGKLKPDGVMNASNKRVWWRCKVCKHEWECAICDRTGLESGCPACYQARLEYMRQHPKPPAIREKIVLGKRKISRQWYEKPSSEEFRSVMHNSLKLAKQWHPTKNGEWSALDFSEGSEAIAWWKCKKGPDHEWQAPIYSRTGRPSGCPFCSGKRVSVTNSLANKFPEIAKEWHPSKNGKLRPKDVTYGSGKKVWWRCKVFSEHEWQTTVSMRTGGRNCPFCAGVKVSKENSLQSLFPYIAAQLHKTKNNGLTGDQISSASSRKVWWQCKISPDHEWEATPGNRTGKGSGCPFCTNKKVSATNSLAALYPHVAEQWYQKKNGKTKPTDVSPTSNIKVWWICDKRHTWEQAICKRVKSPVDCWQCSGRRSPGPSQ